MTAIAPTPKQQQLIEDEDLGRAFDGALLRRLWRWIKPYRRRALLSISLVAPAFLFDVSAIVILGLATNSWAGVSVPSVLAPPAGIDPIWWLGLLFACVSLCNLGLDYVQAMLLATTGQAAMRDLRRDVFAHIQKLHMAFFDGYPVGRHVTRATSDVEHVSEAFTAGLVLLVTDVLRMCGYAVILFAVYALGVSFIFMASLVVAKREKTYEGSMPLVTFGGLTAAIFMPAGSRGPSSPFPTTDHSPWRMFY